ncbi:hypothetical protein G6F57_017501 [Rhizopus arrhizus]|nr:hypothetical protein G6F57_017501 [Rhizopus arrhizus]
MRAASSATTTTPSPAACTASASAWSTRCRPWWKCTSSAKAPNTASPSATATAPPRWKWSAASARRTPFAVRALKHLLRAKAVLCPGLTVKLTDEATGEVDTWYYEDGLRDYLKLELGERESLPADLFVGNLKKDTEVVDWAVAWLPEARHPRQRPAYRPDRGAARVLRLPQPAAARRQAGPGRRVGPRVVRAVAEDDRPAVQRTDQGTPVFAPGRRLRRGRGPRCLPPAAEPERGAGREDRADRHRTRQRAPQDREAGRPQEGHPGPGAARQAGRLHQPGPVAHRAVPGGR